MKIRQKSENSSFQREESRQTLELDEEAAESHLQWQVSTRPHTQSGEVRREERQIDKDCLKDKGVRKSAANRLNSGKLRIFCEFSQQKQRTDGEDDAAQIDAIDGCQSVCLDVLLILERERDRDRDRGREERRGKRGERRRRRCQ